MRPNNLVHIVA
ncbi:hypothetical protein F383_37522 [Gossypium arboreum]|nr:hypothetical protein F383_37522 [Gossypium arboreum]